MSDRELSHAGVSRPSFSRSPTAGTTGLPAHQEEEAVKEPPLHAEKVSNKDGISAAPPVAEPSKSPPPALAEERSSSESPNTPDGNYPTGYRFPPKHTWQQATLIGLKAFWKFFITPFGFLIIIYGANIVAWGGMLFLLLIGGGKALCHPTCNDINSPRRKWIEIDSQILNALFCVTGFGLIPWRFRDLYYLMKFRLQHRYDALRQLAGINRSWFRLAGSENRPVPGIMFAHMPGEEDDRALPLPITAEPDQPLTGIRAPPTPVWKLDLVIWLYVWNTFLQAVLCGFMWGYNRYKRPSWSTGLFVALACIVAAAGGYIVFLEGKKVKKIEGVPWGAEDLLLDAEKGVPTAIEVQEKKEVKVEKKGGWLNKHKNVVVG